MSITKKIILGVLGSIIILTIWFGLTIKGTYNDLIILENHVETQYSHVETMLQRRLDLIPNLVNTAKAYMNHESETYKAIAAFREGLSPYVNEDATGNLTLKEGLTQTQLSQYTGKMMSFRVESYPELKNDLMKDLATNLEGTENRISVARIDYNLSVEKYNNKRDVFPTNLIASFFNFKVYKQFEAEKDANKAPTVNFNK